MWNRICHWEVFFFPFHCFKCFSEFISVHCSSTEDGLYSELGGILCPAVKLAGWKLPSKYDIISNIIHSCNFQWKRRNMCHFKNLNVAIEPLFLQKHVRHTLENFFACLNTCAEVLFKTSTRITPLQIRMRWEMCCASIKQHPEGIYGTFPTHGWRPRKPQAYSKIFK